MVRIDVGRSEQTWWRDGGDAPVVEYLVTCSAHTYNSNAYILRGIQLVPLIYLSQEVIIQYFGRV